MHLVKEKSALCGPRGGPGPGMKAEVALSERSLGSEVDGTLASAMLFTLPSELHQDGGGWVGGNVAS